MRKLVGILGLALLLLPKPAAAHPMGNFSINVHLGIAFEETAVAVTLIVDMAEIPTFQEKDVIDSSGDGQVSVMAQPHDHDHDHDHGHGHDHNHNSHSDHSHQGTTDQALGWRSLAALGLAGGLVPSASAVVLLLGAVSQGDPWFGLGLVAAFGIGMAIALVAAGIAAIWAVNLGWRFISHDGRRQRLQHLVPALAGGSVTLVGVVLLLHAATAWS